MMVAPGTLLQHRLGEDREQLVAPDHPALAVDRADPVGVAVEGDAEVEPFLGDERFRSSRLPRRWDRDGGWGSGRRLR
jgi:hypothetical protein